MKNIFAILLCAVLIVMLAACGNTAGSGGTGSKPDTTTVANAPAGPSDTKNSPSGTDTPAGPSGAEDPENDPGTDTSTDTGNTTDPEEVPEGTDPNEEIELPKIEFD